MSNFTDLTKEEAKEIWGARCEHDGYCEDSEEWCDALDLDPDKVFTFHKWVDRMIQDM